MVKEKKFLGVMKEEQGFSLGKANQVAVKQLHDKGLYSVHGDENGPYLLYPDGQKKYVYKES